MKRIIAISLLSLSLLLSSTPTISAQEKDTTRVKKTQEEIDAYKAEMKAQKKNIVDELKTTGTATKAQMKENADEVRAQLQERKTMTKEEIATKRAEFESKLEEIKDTKKQSMLENVDEKINALNKRHTTRLATHLDKITTILDKIETRAQDASNEAEVTEAVETARTSIEEAQATVDTQAQMVYVFELEDEEDAKAAVKEAFTQFQTDLKAVHEVVKGAHADVREAARTLGKTKSPRAKTTITPTGSTASSEAETEN